MKKILIKLFSRIPNCYLKNKIRCYGFNLYNKNVGFKSYYKKDYFQFNFKNGIIIKSYYDMCGDLKTPIKGYLNKYLPRSGDVVIDCGAYGGAFSIYAAKLVGDNGRIISFEPDSKNYELLLSNIKLNGLNNIIPVNKGLWDSNDTLPFNAIHSGTSSLFDKKENGLASNISVVTIDSEIATLGIKKIDFIKMDVEGAEIEALKGAEKTLTENRVNLAVASYHIRDGKQTCHGVEKLLAGFGYKAETSFPEHLTTYASKPK